MQLKNKVFNVSYVKKINNFNKNSEHFITWYSSHIFGFEKGIFM